MKGVDVNNPMSRNRLESESEAHAGTGGVSAGSGAYGFRPAFLDYATQSIYLSRFADGRPAGFHLIDGLPDEVVVERDVSGRAVKAKATLISGFVRRGFFYTRAAAARARAEWP